MPYKTDILKILTVQISYTSENRGGANKVFSPGS